MICSHANLIARFKGEVAATFKQRTLAAWLEIFSASDGCVEPVISFEEMLSHPQVKARGFVREENGRPVGLNTPFVFARGDRKRTAPGLGEHTNTVLGDILNKQELEDLTNSGIIGGRLNN